MRGLFLEKQEKRRKWAFVLEIGENLGLSGKATFDNATINNVLSLNAFNAFSVLIKTALDLGGKLSAKYTHFFWNVTVNK